MTQGYITVAREGTSRFEDRKSVFLGFAKPVSTEGEAIAFIAEIKSRYPDARHHVYAYSLRENSCTRYSDDREPQGSAGMPVLDVLRHGKVVDTCIVVVRYFGGTLLGTGGLVHAYGTSASEAVDAAGRIQRCPCSVFRILVNYGDYQKLLPILARLEAVVENTEFGADVTIEGSILEEGEDGLQTECRNATAGRAVYAHTGSGFFSIPLK